MQDNVFDFTARIDTSDIALGTHTGLAMFEASASGLEIIQSDTTRQLQYFHLTGPTSNPTPNTIPGPALIQPTIQLRVHIEADTATYFYSLDNGATFQPVGPATPIHFSWWKASRPALFAYTTEAAPASPIDIDWVHYQPTAENPW